MSYVPAAPLPSVGEARPVGRCGSEIVFRI